MGVFHVRSRKNFKNSDGPARLVHTPIAAPPYRQVSPSTVTVAVARTPVPATVPVTWNVPGRA